MRLSISPFHPPPSTSISNSFLTEKFWDKFEQKDLSSSPPSPYPDTFEKFYKLMRGQSRGAVLEKLVSPRRAGLRIRIERIQHFFLLRIRILFWIQGFDEQKLRKILAEKRTPKLQEKPSALKREHLAIQNMKFLYFFTFFFFCGSFLPSWIRIRIQQLKINADPCGSGSATLQERTGNSLLVSR
jgi:hypothetical protein